MNVPEITKVKDHLDDLKNRGHIREWELPYENLLTRLSAAIFFLNATAQSDQVLGKIWQELGRYENFSFRFNEEKKLSEMKYRITFSAEEKQKNDQKVESEVKKEEKSAS